MSYQFVGVDSYIVSITLFVFLRYYISMFTFWGIFGHKIPVIQAITAYQCYMDKWEQCENVLMVCGSRLIYGLHHVIRVSELLYINVSHFGAFFETNITSFQAITAYQCYMNEWEQCQNILIVCRSRLIYGLHEVIRVSELLYINVYILMHLWAQNNKFFGHNCMPVLHG